MNKSILLTRPDHDTATNYLCVWSEYVLKEAFKKHITVYDLKGAKATKINFDSYLKAKEPGFLFLNGHGNAKTVTGFNNEPLLEPNSDKKLVKDTIIYARSCDAGQILGNKLVKEGVRVFIGYRRKFLCAYLPSKISKPLEDPLVKFFLLPSNLIPTTILKGHSAKIAHERSIIAMQKNFRKMISSVASPEERFAAKWLYGNIKGQVLFGDKDASIY